MYWDSCCSQRRYLGADALDLGGRVLDVEAILQAALLAFLREPKHVAIDLEIVVGDPDLGLHAAQLDVVARQFGEARDQRVAALVGGLIDGGVGGFDLPADLAPQVQFPGCIEADIVVVDRADIGRRAARRHQHAQQADDAVLAIQLAGIFRIAVDRREFRGGRHAALEPALGQPDRRGPHVEIGGGDAMLQIGQDRIAKHRPPCRIRWRRQSRIGNRSALVARERCFRQLRIGRHEVRPDRAARGQQRSCKRRDDASFAPRRHQCAAPGRAAAGLRRHQKAERDHQECDDGAIKEHIGIGQHGRLQPIRLIDAPDRDVMNGGAGAAHRPQRLFIGCDQGLVGLMERTSPLRKIGLMDLRALGDLRRRQ